MRPTPAAVPKPLALLSGFLALAVVLFGCSAPSVRPAPEPLATEPDRAAPAPRWLEDPHAEHPSGRWLCAVGQAELGASAAGARERAELAARGAFVRNLSSQVRSVTEVHDLFESDGKTERVRVSLDQTVEVVGEGMLEGARPADFWIDVPGSTAYCLLVLERAPAALELARRIEEKEADAARLLARARTAAAGAALLTLCDAYDLVVAARLLRISYAVIAGGPLTRRDAVGDEVLASLRAAANGLTLRVESGQAQRGRVGGQLEAPIVFQLVGPEGRGVDGVDLQFELVGPAKAELSASRQLTVAGGASAVRIRAIGASGQRSNHVRCRVAALVQRELAGPSATAEFLLPAAADVRVLLGTDVKVFGEDADGGPLHAGVLSALGGAGFAVVPPSAVAERIAPEQITSAPVHELCTRLRGAVDWVVRVEGAARESAARGDRLRARSTADVVLVDVATGAIDRLSSDPVDGLGETHAHAAAGSLERLGVVVGGDVVARLRARVGL